MDRLYLAKFHVISVILFTLSKAKQHPDPVARYMRQTRKLAQGVWYEIRSGINNREPLLRQPKGAALFDRVFRETMLRFPFEVRGLCIEADRISFYIKPEDGLELPAIMQWMKQVFAQRYNALTGRSGHIWGDRYWSLILEGDPPEDVGAAFGAEARGKVDRYRGRSETPNTGVRPRQGKRGSETRFSAVSPAPTPPASG
jgi:REP element-mobilizing transposase RayT